MNGGFESGNFKPWQAQSCCGIKRPTKHIVSPGYNSEHALQMDWEPAHAPGWFFSQPIAAEDICVGSQYNVTFAVNWLNYTGPTSHLDQGCYFSANPGDCDMGNQTSEAYATSEGWKAYSYTCKALGKTMAFDVDVTCTDTTPEYAAFSLQVDGLSFARVGP